MAELKVGDSIPSGVKFSYVPYTPENGDITSCGIPINYDATKGMVPFPSSLHLSAVSMCYSSKLTPKNHRMGQQESRRLLRPRCLHSELLR